MATVSRLTMATAAILLAFLFIQTNAAAIDKCNAGCQGGSEPKDGFQAGNTYSYWLEGVSHVRLSGADQQETAVRISAMATVIALGNCANILKVTSLQIASPDGLRYSKVKDIEKPVRFTLQDGVLGSDICAEEGDNQFSLNIKRALLSLLQTATKFNTEVDIFGVCPTTFGVQRDGANAKAVHKTKNLNTCAYREQGRNDLMAYIYNPNAKLKDTNIMKAQMKVDTMVRNGIVEKVEAQEDYLYRPFSVGNQGATTSVTSKLTLKETNKGTIQSKCVVPKSIIFENPHPVATPHSNLNNVAQALNHAVKVLNNKVESRSATVFGTLVKVMRVTSRDDLLNLYGQIQAGAIGKENKDLAKRVFLDALFRAGTGESVEVAIKLLQNNELTPIQKKLAFLAMGTIRHSSPEAIKAVTSLLGGKDIPNSAYIGAGALAGTYCKEHPCHGAGNKEVKDLSAKLVSRLGNGKPETKSEEDTVIAVLKGIRNIHHLEDSVADKLAAIAVNKNAKQRVRVNAFEAYAADACIQKLQNSALRVLKDVNEDSEIRIKAYLALLECPTAKTAGELKTLLDSEPVNQVGSFITSSLRNIRNSANPSRQVARQYFGSIAPTKKFPLDGRKYSQNYEISYDFDTLGAGAIADSNVIFSQNSFLPRSASLNLTAEIFGRNINFIEIGARQGNLDRVIEEFLGPYGSLRTHTPQQIYDYLKNAAVSISEKINERNRPKRDVKQQTDSFGKKLKTDIPGYNGDLDLDIFVRLFGSDAIFLSLGDDKPFSLPDLIDKIFNVVDDGVNKAEQFSHEIRTHVQLMDAELAYPTSNGLTMKVNIDAYATSKLEFGGNINLKNLLKDVKNAKIDLKVIPSANIECSGTISFDADVVATGLKVITAMHTSTGGHIVAKLEEKGFDMQLGLPVEKQEIITHTNDVYFFTREKGKEDIDKEVKFNTDSWRKFSDCFDQLSSAVGLSVCADVFVPWMQENKKSPTVLPFPLGGPTKIGLRLEKDDLKGFHIHGSVNDEKKTGTTLIELSVEADGSKKPRKVSWQLEKINRPDLMSLKMKLLSPVKQLQAHATLTNSNKEKSVSVGVKNDNEDYYAKMGVSSANANQNTVTYKPILEYNIAKIDGEPAKLEGTITKTGNKYTFNGLSMVYKGNKIVIDGTLTAGDHSLLDLKVGFGDKKATIQGKYDKTETSRTTKLDFRNTIDNSFDFLVEADLTKSNDLKKINFVLVHGPDPNSQTSKLKFSATLKGKTDHLMKAGTQDSEPLDIEYKSELSYPLLGIELKNELEVAPKKFDLELDARYGEQKFEFETELKCDMKNAGDFYTKFETKVNGKGVESIIDYGVTEKNKGAFESTLQVMNSPVYELKGTLSHKVEDDDVDVAVRATLKARGEPEDKTYKMDVFCINNPSKHSSGFKAAKGSDDLVNYQLNMINGENKSGDLTFLVKGLLKGQGKFKNEANKNGNGELLVDMIKANRKMKLDTKFNVVDSVCNANADLYLDFEKDNNNKVSFNTNTKYVKGNIQETYAIDSKNVLAFDNKKIELLLKNEQTKKDSNFKRNALISFTLPQGVSVALKEDIETTKTGEDKYSATYNRLVQCTAREGAKPYSLELKGVAKNVNKNNKTIDLSEQYTFTNEKGENLNLKYKFIVDYANNRHFVDVKGDVSGSLAPNTINVDVGYDVPNEEDTNDELFDCNYKFKGSYGQKTNAEAKGKFFSTNYEEKDDKWGNDVDVHIVTPFEKSSDIKFNSKDLVIIPVADDQWFSISTKKRMQINGENHNYEVDLTLGDNDGKTKVVVQVPKTDKVVLDSAFHHAFGDENQKGNGHFNLDYGKGKQLRFKIDGEKLQGKQATLNTDVTLPEGANYKHIVSNFIIKKLGEHSFSSDLKAEVDGQKYNYNSVLDYDRQGNTKFELKREAPNKKPAKFAINSQKLTENHVKGSCKIENVRDFDMDLNVDAMLFGPDHWDIKVDLDCPKLKINKVLFKASNEALKTGNKKIEFSATENNNNVLSGVTTYQSKQEGNKFIMEGSGTVKVKNEEKPTSFKYIREKPTGSDYGVEVLYNVDIGGKNVLIEYKNTNMQYKFHSIYCEESKQCAHINIDNKHDTTDPNKHIHDLKFDFDLKKLGFAPEFGLTSKTELEKFRLPVHSLDMHLNQDSSKYHTNVYAKPVKGNYKTALTLTTPKRVISLESTTTYPEKISMDTKPHFNHETFFYPNKQGNPKSKTVFKVHSDTNKIDENTYNSNNEVLFTSPAVGNDLKIASKTKTNLKTGSLSGELILDIFRKENQKVLTTFSFNPILGDKSFDYKSNVNIDANGLGFTFKATEEMSLSPEQFKLTGRVNVDLDKQKKEGFFIVDLTKTHQKIQFVNPITQLILIENTLSASDDTLINFNSKTILLGELPYIVQGSVKSKSPYGFKLSGENTNTKKKLELEGLADINKKAEVKSTFNDGNTEKVLAVVGLYIEDKMIVPKSKIDTANFKDFEQAVVQDVKTLNNRFKTVASQTSEMATKNFQRLTQSLKGALPDINAAINPYVEELKAFEKELENDKAAQDIAKAIKNIVLPILKVVSDVIEQANVILKKTIDFGNEVFERLSNLLNKQVIPELTAFFNKIYSVLNELIQLEIDLISHYIAIAGQFVEKHIKPFEPLIKDVLDYFKEINKALVKELKGIQEQTIHFFEELKEQIENLPITGMIAEMAEEYNLKETLVQVLQDVLEAIRIVVPHEGFQDLIDCISEYLTKKIKDEKVNDSEELKKIFEKTRDLAKGLTSAAESQIKTPSGFTDVYVAAPTSWLSVLAQVSDPSLPSFSLWNAIVNDDYPDLEEIIQSYWPRSLNPMDMIPPMKLQGQVVGGSHIFTFDGRHLTFPGQCRYVLSQDAVDGNFSVVMQLEAGQPKTITLVDKSGNAMEVNTKAELQMNGAKYGFPVWKSDTYAWKTQHYFALMTKYGVYIKCTLDIEICSIFVSGYYSGKVRGLLGDGNNEPYDDFRLPNGKITTSENEFGNAYALTTCPPVTNVLSHSHGKRSPVCTQYLEEENSILCENAVSKKNYETACKHATMDPKYATNEKAAACLMARAYSMACRNAGFFVGYPDSCDTCDVDGHKYNNGDDFEIKVPQKQADIILSVETTTENKKNFKELAVPLLNNIIEELKTKKVNDVKIYLIGLSPKMPFPIYHDIESNTVKGTEVDFKDQQRSQSPGFPIVTEHEKLDKFLNQTTDLIHKMIVNSGLANIQISYNMLSHFEWRPKAVKSIIMVHSQSCPDNPLVLLSSMYSSVVLQDVGASVHLIAPVTDLKSKDTKNVIGFSKEHVFVLGDKKRGLSHDNLREDVTYEDDGFVDLAEEANGNIYSSTEFFKLNPGQRTNFLQLASNTIVDTMVNNQVQLKCTCRTSISQQAPKVSCSVSSKKSTNKKAGGKK